MRKPPIHAPKIAGAPAMSASAGEAPEAERLALGDRRGDPEPLGDVVDHEADDEERPERQLAERERGSDREALAEVVEADPDRDEGREGEPAERAALRGARAAEPPREEGQGEVARGDAEQRRARCRPGRRAAPPAARAPR